MALTRNDFLLSDKDLEKLNGAIQKKVAELLAESAEEDPPDALSVTFNFVFGFGRNIEVSLAGTHLELPDFE